MAESEVVMPDGFPAGLRVFAVGDDSVVLRSLELMLVKCGYKVTTSNHALQALELLRANKAEFDIVITDINLPEMDGFKLLEIVAIEMNLPVIMLSVDSDFKSVMKGIKYGAVDYLIKPVRFEELRLIWKHVIKRSLSEKKDLNESKFDVRVSQHTKKPKDRVRERVEDDNFDSEDDSTSRKRARVNWTPELHTKFINAINQLGIDRAVPKKILDLMEIPGLSRENVASHLQKYRKGLKRNTIEFSQQVLGLAATRGYSGSSLPITFNRSRANLYKNKSVYSSYLPDQQFRNNHALDSRSWFPSMRHHNTFCSQYMANSLGNQLGAQQLGLTTNSCLMNMSTQLSGYQSLNNTSSNWLNCQAERSQNPWISDGYAKPNSVSQLGGIMDQQVTETFSNNNFNDNGNSNEFATLFTFEEEEQQINSGSIADAEMERQVNIGSIDVQSFNFEDHRESNDSDLTAFSEEHLSAETIEKVLEFDNFDYTDDLHIVLREFQQENL